MRQLIQKRRGPNGKITTYIINVPSYDDTVVVSSGGDDDDVDGGGGDGSGGGGGYSGIWTIGISTIGGGDVLS